MSQINIWQKSIRANVIAAYLQALGTARCVCYSSGNSAKALAATGLDVLHVGPGGHLHPTDWHEFIAIAKLHGRFDATSGHLPWPLMVEIAKLMRVLQEQYDGPLEIPTGSGETLVCLKLAYPQVPFTAVYGEGPTLWHPQAPLNALVAMLMEKKGAPVGTPEVTV